MVPFAFRAACPNPGDIDCIAVPRKTVQDVLKRETGNMDCYARFMFPEESYSLAGAVSFSSAWDFMDNIGLSAAKATKAVSRWSRVWVAM
jgi:hypothetical protein